MNRFFKMIISFSGNNESNDKNLVCNHNSRQYYWNNSEQKYIKIICNNCGQILKK